MAQNKLLGRQIGVRYMEETFLSALGLNSVWMRHGALDLEFHERTSSDGDPLEDFTWNRCKSYGAFTRYMVL